MARRRRKRGCGCGVWLLLLVILALCLLWFRQDDVKEFCFPREYERAVEKYAREYDLDKWLVMAVIREESGYDITASSHKGATGLMQLMPATAEWIVEKADFDFSAEEILSDPICNIQAGCWYLDWLRDAHYPDNMVCVIASYNAGASTVDSWLSEGIWDGTLEDVDRIPYDETRQYVEYVFRSYETYKILYDS